MTSNFGKSLQEHANENTKIIFTQVYTSTDITFWAHNVN